MNNTTSLLSAQPRHRILSIGELDFSRLRIPDYQRPYKWGVSNVNQLIDDLQEFREQDFYRLGTLVLNRDGDTDSLSIVDGQQRVVTLALMLKQMPLEEKGYEGLAEKVNDFCANTSLPLKISRRNVVENSRAIETRRREVEALTDFLCQRCQVVVVELDDISEAFQFFDSQNSRGKDLEPHDLLKPFHLREMDSTHRTASQEEDLKFWQDTELDVLSNLFLTLYRAKRWPEGLPALRFTKADVGTFKGVSLNEEKPFPFTMLELMAEKYISSHPDEDRKPHDDYPYNLSREIVNGGRFFAMVRHYLQQLEYVRNAENFSGETRKVLDLINSYEGRNRTGDRYVRALFDTLLLTYIDRFGEDELDRAINAVFVAAYTPRLRQIAVQLKTIDNEARDLSSLFKVIRRARKPSEVANVYQEALSDSPATRCEPLKERFRILHKLNDQKR